MNFGRMTWIEIKNRIQKLFNHSEKKKWLEKLIQNLEELNKQDKNIPFKIIDIKVKGFSAKVCGLFAFISFNHMPWQYPDQNFWKIVFPHLQNKIFFCRIYKFERSDQLKIILDGQIAQFKQPELIESEEYRGLILKKPGYGLIIDIGLHFNWQCGSLVGILHKTQIKSDDSLDNYSPGDEITIEYRKKDENGLLYFGSDVERTDWFLQEPQKLVGQVVWARVMRVPGENQVSLSVKGKYKAYLPISKEYYDQRYIKRIKKAKDELYDGKIINCEVVGFERLKRTLKVKWLTEVDTDIIPDNPLMLYMDSETLERLLKMKNDAEQ